MRYATRALGILGLVAFTACSWAQGPVPGQGATTNRPGVAGISGTTTTTNPPSSTAFPVVNGVYAYPLLNTNGVVIWPTNFWAINSPLITGGAATNLAALSNMVILSIGGTNYFAALTDTNMIKALMLLNGAKALTNGSAAIYYDPSGSGSWISTKGFAIGTSVIISTAGQANFGNGINVTGGQLDVNGAFDIWPDGSFSNANMHVAANGDVHALNIFGTFDAGQLIGTLPGVVFPATLPVTSGVNLTALNAANLASGIIPFARAGGLTNHNDVNITALTVGDGLVWSGTAWTNKPPGGSGTVTSVGLTMPAEFSVSGSPVTGASTIAVTKANQSANKVFAGPTTGSAAAPTMRSLDAADLPIAITGGGLALNTNSGVLQLSNTGAGTGVATNGGTGQNNMLTNLIATSSSASGYALTVTNVPGAPLSKFIGTNGATIIDPGGGISIGGGGILPGASNLVVEGSVAIRGTLSATNGINSYGTTAGGVNLWDGTLANKVRIQAPANLSGVDITNILPNAVATGFFYGTASGNNITWSQPSSIAALDTLVTAEASVASATTTDIGAQTSQNLNVTGTTTITGLGTTTAGVRRYLKFAGALTLTHNASSLILPNAGANITTAAGDTAMALSLGSGNWRIERYTRADGTALAAGASGAPSDAHYLTTQAESGLSAEANLGALASGILKQSVSGGVATPAIATEGSDYYKPGGTDVAVADGGTGASSAAAAMDNLATSEATVASATTTDLGAVTSQKVSITGTTTITGFGTVAAGVIREGRFTGTLTLTHNATSLIIPGGANITTAAGDRFRAYSLGSGNWVVEFYQKADGTAIVGATGGGDFSSNTGTSVDSEVVLFSGTGGKTGKRATGSGIAKLTSGVLGTATAASDYVAPGTTLTINGTTLDLSANRTFLATTATPQFARLGLGAAADSTIEFLAEADGIGTTVRNSVLLRNATAAAVGAQQVSGALSWEGRGWKTTATAASQPVAFRAYVEPVQGTANPTAIWHLEYQINGGSWLTGVTVDSTGSLTAGAEVIANNLTDTGLADNAIPKVTAGSKRLGNATAGSDYYAPGSTDVAIADGGTGQSTANAGLDALNQTAEASLASATTTDLGAQTSQQVSVTGTTTITGFGTVAAGTIRFVRFTGILTLTHNSTSLILPTAANITTAVGDRLVARSEGSGNWRVWSYTRADGTALASTFTTSSTDTLTNKRITARVTTITSSATPAINTDNADCVTITALAAAITSMTSSLTGTPNNFDQLEIRMKDDGTARAITWGASYVSGPATLPTTTTASKALHVYLCYDSVQAKWVCMSTGSDA